MRHLMLAAAAASIAACNQPPESEPADTPTAAEDPATEPAPAASTEETLDSMTELTTVDENAPPASGDERFYGRETFTIESEQTGVETGSVVEHVREWGRKRVEIKNTTLSIAGVTQSTSTRTIYEGASIVTVDEATGAVTTMENPLYDTIVARMKGKSGVDFGKEIMTEMGGRETDEEADFAGHGCRYWELASLGTKTCVTPWGGSLHTIANLGGISYEKTAIAVRIGDGGPDSAFEYDASNATAAPSLQDIMDRMRPPSQPN